MAQDKKALKQAEKEAKREKRAARRAQYKQLWQAFQMQRKQDKKLIPLMVGAIIVLTVIGFLFGHFVWGGDSFALVGFMFGLLAAMMIFSKRFQSSMYSRAEGQPGAAAWVLNNLKSGVGMMWKTTPSVAANVHMDAVHRTVGLCGVVLVGEGDVSRVRPMLVSQRKKLGRICPTTPIFEFIVGDGEGQVPLKKLQKELMRLPRVMKKDEAYALAARLESIDKSMPGGPQGMPKGPLPSKARMSGMGRRARRTQSRKKG